MSIETNEQPEEKLSVKTENELREVEKTLEDIGERICSVRGSSVTHGRINLALDEIREAIHNCYLMDTEDAE